MNTWEVARLMSESEDRKEFQAVSSGQKAEKFGDKKQSKKPYLNCNTEHRVQGWRTTSGSGSNSHALTDSIIADIRLRDTDDGFSLNANHAHQHKVGLKIEHNGKEKYSWTMSGIQDANTNDWKASKLYLIDAPGEWTLYTRSLESHSCGKISSSWKKVGSFTAKEAHEDCFMKFREDTDTLGVCGGCIEGYKEWAGNCVAESSLETSDDIGGSSSPSSDGSTDNTTTYMIGGGVLLLALLLRRKRKGGE